MFRFTAQGTITGFKAGEERTTIMVKPASPADFVGRDDRESSLNLELGEGVDIGKVPFQKSVVVEGVFARTFHSWKDPVSGRKKDIENYRWMVLKITAVPG